MKLANMAALTLLLLAAAGCGGGGGGPAPSASAAFVAGIQPIVTTSPEDDEPVDISNTSEASDDEVEPLLI